VDIKAIIAQSKATSSEAVVFKKSKLAFDARLSSAHRVCEATCSRPNRKANVIEGRDKEALGRGVR